MMMEDQKLKNPGRSSSMESCYYSSNNSDSEFNSTVTLSFDSDQNTSSPTNGISDSDNKLHLLQWAKTARRGRKSLSTSTTASTSTLSYSSKQKLVEPLSGRNEAVDTQLPLSDHELEDHKISSMRFSEASEVKEVEVEPLSGEKVTLDTRLPLATRYPEHHSLSGMNIPESSNEKQVEKLSSEKTAVDALLPLVDRCSEDHNQITDKNRITVFPDLKRKREIEVEDNNINCTKELARIETAKCREEIIFDILKDTNVNCTKDIARIETANCRNQIIFDILKETNMKCTKDLARVETANCKAEIIFDILKDTNINCTKDLARVETANCKDEIIFDILKETNFEATYKQVPGKSFGCDSCGKSFNCHQALGGHKSSCKSNLPKTEVGESSLQGSMKNPNFNKINESTKQQPASSGPHQCKFCSMCFATGQALGGHQGMHRTGPVRPRIGTCLSLSQPNGIMRKEAVSRLASSVQQARDEVATTNKKRKIMLFGINLAENLPEKNLWN